MKCRITVLCDNSVGPIAGTLGEHGFAALLECGGEHILFDTGQGQCLLHNACRMNRDLGRVTKIALSHGHYDHTGGIRPFMERFGGAEVFAHPGIFSRRFRVKDTGDSVYIGIPETEASLRAIGASFTYNRSFTEIADRVYLTGEVPPCKPSISLSGRKNSRSGRKVFC